MRKWLVLVILVVLSGVVWWHSIARPTTPALATVMPERATVVKKSVINGALAPRKEIKLKSTINGVVESVYVEPRQLVKRGDLIARLRVVTDPTEISEAVSRLERARIEFERNAEYLTRRRVLREQQVISENDFQDDLLKFNLSQEALAAAQRHLALKRNGYTGTSTANPTQVRATIDGMVLDREVEVGDFVIKASEFAEGTTIATIADMRRMVFSGEVDESDAGRLQAGMRLSVSVTALPGERFEAVLESIAPRSTKNETGRVTYRAQAVLEQHSGTLVRAGYTATAEIVFERRENALTIPESFVLFDDGQARVRVLDLSGEAQTRVITTGLSDGLRIEVLAGLAEGEHVAAPQVGARAAQLGPP